MQVFSNLWDRVTGRSELVAERDTYRHAWQTTAADRDRLAAKLDDICNPLDAGFFRLELRRISSPDSTDSETVALLRTWRTLCESGEYDKCVKSILETTRVRIAQQNGPDYFKPFASYYVASILAMRGDHDAASALVDGFDFDAVPDGTDFLPYELRVATRLSRMAQDIAIEKGKPGAIVVSLQKSASASLTSAIAATIGVPVLRVTLGEGPESMVVPRWAAQINRGGATTHEHFRATESNLRALHKAGVGRIWVQIRDPRDASHSLSHMGVSRPLIDKPASSMTAEQSFLHYSNMFGRWIAEWLDAKASGLLDVEYIRFEEVAADLPAVLRRIFPAADLPPAPSEPNRNFRSGRGGEWRQFPEELQARAFDGIPERVRNYLNLTR